MSILVAKADGSTEEFNSEKLRQSLRRVGAADDAVDAITAEVMQGLYSGIPTNEIYRRAFALLRNHRRGVAARYSLKRAVLEFGPSGFPFEAYMAELFRVEGYTARIDQIVQGACVEHEVDVVIEKDGQVTYVEAKFHNTAGFKTDLKTSLYVKARIDDIAAVEKASPVGQTWPRDKKVQGMIVTNTKFTSKAVQYATCEGLGLLGWEYPQDQTLHDRIDAAKLYPVTALTSLTKKEKMALLSDKKVLCNSLVHDTDALLRAGVKGKKADMVLEEVGALCVPGKDI